MNKKKLIGLTAIFLVAIFCMAFYLFDKNKSQDTPPPMSNIGISTSSDLSPTATTTTSTSTNLVSIWYNDKQLTTGEIVLNGNLNATVLPVIGLTPTELTGKSLSDRKTTYTSGDLNFVNDRGRVEITSNKDTVINFKTYPLFGVSSFEYGGIHYFITKSTDCGTDFCASKFNLVFLESTGDLKLGEATWETSDPASSEIGSVAGVLVIDSKLYIIVMQQRSIATIIINGDGHLQKKVVFDGAYEGVELERIIPGWSI